MSFDAAAMWQQVKSVIDQQAERLHVLWMVDGTVELDEYVAVLLLAACVFSLISTFANQAMLLLLRLPCLRECLMRIEVQAEVFAMNSSVRRAFTLASQEQDKELIEKVMSSATAGGPAQPSWGATSPNFRPSAASQALRARRQMGASAQALVLAESKAATSKADDAQKDARKLRPREVDVSTQSQKTRYPRGRAGVKVDKRGKATLVYPGDGVYEGEYVDGKKEGKGRFWYVSGSVYEGSWRNDEKHGKGKETYSDGAVYEGHFSEGSRHGFGMLTYANRDVYEGDWESDIKHGHGTFRWSAGTVYEGEWENGVMHGSGTYHFADGCTYQGQYADGKRNGRGIYRFLDGSVFEGEYRDGIVEGRGTFTFADGSAEVGRWEDGLPVGEATRFSPDRKNAWRLFDGHVTGPVSMDLADVIAQMAFRPKAARLARAVRDQLALVHLEEQRDKFQHKMPGSRRTVRASTPPISERPAWVGVREFVSKAPPRTSPYHSPFSSPGRAPISSPVSAIASKASKATPPPGYMTPPQDRYMV